MKAMILAAGLGTRMRPLTDTVPKALLPIGDTTLIENLILQLKSAGIREIIINTFHLGSQIQKKLLDGKHYGVSIQYSDEKHYGHLLDTGGGVNQVLPLLGHQPFLLVSCDIWTNFPFEKLIGSHLSISHMAHLILIPNTLSEISGQFDIEHGDVRLDQAKQYTYANIGLFHPECFSDHLPDSAFPLKTVIEKISILRQASGEIYKGLWYNVGTPEKLKVVQQFANKRIPI
jgi:MurNAc alpha-1-phosphate uridylyltransferase